MCTNSGCIIIDVISWLWNFLKEISFISGIVSGIVSGILVIAIEYWRREIRLKKRWRWIVGKYSSFSVKENAIINNEVIEITQKSSTHFAVKCTGGTNPWTGSLEVHEKLDIGNGTFKGDKDEKQFGAQCYHFFPDVEKINLYGIRYGRGDADSFAQILEKDDKSIAPE
jgi:hypothetical protein